MAIFVFSILFILFTIEVFNPKKPKKSSNLHQCKPCCNPHLQDGKPNLEGKHPKTTQKSSPGTRPAKSRG